MFPWDLENDDIISHSGERNLAGGLPSENEENEDHLKNEHKEQATPSVAFRTSSSTYTAIVQTSKKSDPHHIDSIPMHSTSHRSDHSENSNHNSSPPPIATLSNSPALSVSSLDRSSESTPPPRRSTAPSSLQSTTMYSSFPYTSDGQIRQQSRPHNNTIPTGRIELSSTHSYTSGYSTHGNFERRYELNQSSDNVSYQMHSTIPGSQMGGEHGVTQNRGGYGVQFPPSGPSSNHIVHTDDATTKLSERVRRRCFNCCTTDTSTWRRSNLSPGKVLCNKCGLFERTHSRPRPEQFPHKRGPLATSTLRSRNSTSPQPPPPPPLSRILTHTLPPPHHFGHPAIAPLNSPDSQRPYQSPNALPEIHSWLHEPSSSAPLPAARRTMAPPAPPTKPGSPHSRSQGPLTSSGAPFEPRDHQNIENSGIE